MIVNLYVDHMMTAPPSTVEEVWNATKEHPKLYGIDGDGWWASRNWRKKLARFDKTTGACRWAVGSL